ncbi:hypothetical protein E3O55_07625 [Cryobacterium sp. MDB1-18-2]|uniref:hypothetical protein n=1 Tax=unclassified Cryobacterium TaxID=2649013 RepID=UPI00106D60BE|nr:MULTISPECIES: hypothetical protein [unclassified Cryobacterium]TFC30740.1 hypothetical protein E3O55_07625 [Cryobacterium sp. MDB1-18-2]TFC38310.1 hypothetical protein E3O50_16780 [Cryobacterium sp. MDB1-18-1]
MAKERAREDFTNVRRFAVILPLVAALLGAAIGAGGAVWGAYISADLQAENVRNDQLLNQREAVYKSFLIKSNDFANASGALSKYQQAGHSAADVEENLKLINDFRNARYDFRGAINDVFVYGTDRSWAAGELLIGTLPDTMGQEAEFGYSPETYNAAYKEFQSVFCSEAQPDRKDCLPGS